MRTVTLAPDVPATSPEYPNEESMSINEDHQRRHARPSDEQRGATTTASHGNMKETRSFARQHDHGGRIRPTHKIPHVQTARPRAPRCRSGTRGQGSPPPLAGAPSLRSAPPRLQAVSGIGCCLREWHATGQPALLGCGGVAADRSPVCRTSGSAGPAEEQIRV